MDWSPSRNEGDKVLFIFDGGVIDEDGHAQLELESAELSDVRYFDRAERAAVLNERLTRRVSAALDAKADQHSRYLEHGRLAPSPWGQVRLTLPADLTASLAEASGLPAEGDRCTLAAQSRRG